MFLIYETSWSCYGLVLLRSRRTWSQVYTIVVEIEGSANSLVSSYLNTLNQEIRAIFTNYHRIVGRVRSYPNIRRLVFKLEFIPASQFIFPCYGYTTVTMESEIVRVILYSYFWLFWGNNHFIIRDSFAAPPRITNEIGIFCQSVLKPENDFIWCPCTIKVWIRISNPTSGSWWCLRPYAIIRIP